MAVNESNNIAQMSSNVSVFWLRLFHFALILAPPIYLIFLLARYQIDLPVWDQWPQVDLLDKLFQGQLTFADIWRQHNEHRQPFPRMIMLGLAYASHWNMAWELLFNLLAGAACFAVFGYQVIKTLKVTNTPIAMWLFPALSLLIFSVAQYENWFWGFAINIYLHLICVLGTIVLLSHPVFGWYRFLAAMLLAIVATYSAPTAFFIWPLGALLLFSVHYSKKRIWLIAVVLWLLIGIALLGIYFKDFVTPAHLEQTRFYREPIAYTHFVLNYVGAPLLRTEYSYIVGLVGLFAFCFIPWRLLRTNIVTLPQLAPFLAICFFVVGAALLAGVGRVGHGDGLDSRYVSVSLWFWAAILVMGHLLFIRGEPAPPVSWIKWGEFLILSTTIIILLDIIGIGWRLTGQPYWPWLGLLCLGFVSFLHFNLKLAEQHARFSLIGLFLALFASVLIAENSLRNGKDEAIWSQHHHYGEAREKAISSGEPAFCPDAPLITLSPEFPPERTRSRLAVLVRHKLAAYRDK
jgi:hypothetical protein